MLSDHFSRGTKVPTEISLQAWYASVKRYGQTLHWRGERNAVGMVGGCHPNRGGVEVTSSFFRGSIKLGSLFRVFPTALPTFHTFISSADRASADQWADVPDQRVLAIAHSPVDEESRAFDCVSAPSTHSGQL